jgi:hypothetical protein
MTYANYSGFKRWHASGQSKKSIAPLNLRPNSPSEGSSDKRPKAQPSSASFEHFIQQFGRLNPVEPQSLYANGNPAAGSSVTPAAVAAVGGPSRDDVVTYLSHIDANGKADVFVTAAVEHHVASKDYHPAKGQQPNKSIAHKFGAHGVGTSGGVVQFFFDAKSAFTEAEKDSFRTGFALWAGVANIQFQETTALKGQGITIKRGTDGGARTDWSYRSVRPGSTTLDAPSDVTISIDPKAFGAFAKANNSTLSTIVHEIGHAIGLDHAGSYDGDIDLKTEQNGAYDNSQWSVMSYVNPDDKNARYYTGLARSGTNWNDVASPMILDIEAAQRLYGAPTAGALQGGQIFGFHSNITGPSGRVFDFTKNAKPVLTIYDAGENNTLDLSGWKKGALISLIPGTFSSASADGKMINNIAIAEHTKIDHVIGTGGNDTIIPNPDVDTVITGGGGMDLFESTLAGFDGSTINDLGIGDIIHFIDADITKFHFSDDGKFLDFGILDKNATIAMPNDPLGTFKQIADVRGGVDLTLVASSAFA